MKKQISKYILVAAAMLGLNVSATAASAGEISSPLKLSVREPAFYSPQVMELMRYDNHATINPNTGCVTPTINLIHYQDKDFDFPISISYNSSGFRPRNIDNYVGRDWMLNAGGVVYRQVNGIPDDFSAYKENPNDAYGYTGFRAMLGKNAYNVNTMKQDVKQNPYKYAHLKDFSSTMLTLPTTDNGQQVESAPDVFYFSFGKHSGKFMMNYDGSVSVIGYDGGKYQVDLTGMKLFSNTSPQDTYIRIQTDDGYVYTFGGGGYAALEYNSLSWKNDYNFTPNPSKYHHEITAFHLTQIKAPNGRVLNIRYRDIESKFHVDPHSNLTTLNQQGRYENQTDLLMQYQLCGKRAISTPYVIGNMDLNTGINPSVYTQANVTPVYSLNKIALIDRIETDLCTIRFTYSTRSKQPFPVTNSAKQFFISCGAKLDEIRMTYNGSTESAKLTYDYALGNRMFLKSAVTSQEGTYKMEYNTSITADVPNPLTCNIDHWGFWRGENTNVALIPGMAYPNSQYSLNYKITTNHRDATGKRYDISLLRQMSYPTGGCAEFSYEPHKYSTIIQQNDNSTFYPTENSLSPSVSGTAGGARIRSVRYKDAAGNALKETIYTYGSLSKEGKVMYMPFYRHLMVQKLNGSNEYVKVMGAAFNSEGFTSRPYQGVHIRYPEVTEHYIDPAKGGLEQKHPYKKIEFQTNLALASSYYSENEYFQTLSTAGSNNIYSLFTTDYLSHLKHLAAHPTDDIAIFYSKMLRETFYDENNVNRKKVEYSYAYQNKDNYSLYIFCPNISDKLMLNLFSHIGREYFRMLLPVGKQTTDYYGKQGEQQRIEWENMKYDVLGYLTEHSRPKNKLDSLVTAYRYKEYLTNTGFQMLPTVIQHYIGASNQRVLLRSHEMEYRLLENTTGQKWNLVSKESLFDGSKKLTDMIEYTHYDKYGNPIEKVANGSLHTVFLWSHYGQSLRARIDNASYQEVNVALGKKPEDLSASTTDASALNSIRARLPNARVESYWAGNGKYITSVAAANGRLTNYGYYSGGRLGQVFRLSEKGVTEMLQMNDYHFVNK